MWPLQGSSNQTRTHPKKNPQKPSICSMESFRLRVSNKSPKWNEPLQYALLEGLFRVCVFHSASKQTQMICSRWNLFVIKFLSQTARLFFFFSLPLPLSGSGDSSGQLISPLKQSYCLVAFFTCCILYLLRGLYQRLPGPYDFVEQVRGW